MQLLNLISYVWRHPLNAGDRLRALGRVFRWQVASRLLAGPIALPFVEGTSLFASRGMSGATGNWYCGLHEAAEMGFILHLLRPGDLFVDVGANIGSYTLIAAGGVGARVISIEPIPTTFSSLRRNVLLNGLADRVELHCVGLSNERSELRFSSDRDTMNHIMAEGELGSAIEVPVITMDELLAGQVPTAIKIDVEGHELSVLRGAQKTLSNPSLAAVVLEINGSGARYGVSDAALLELMRGHGFEPCSYDPLARSLRDWVPSSDNAVFVRSRTAMNAHATQAKRYRLVNRTI